MALQRTMFLNVIRKDLCVNYISTVNVNLFIPLGVTLVTPSGMYLIAHTHILISYLYLPRDLGICTGDIHKKIKWEIASTSMGYGP